MKYSFVTVAMAGLAAGAALLMNERSLTGEAGIISTAGAIIGRPATPMSYAGVARRTTAGAVGVGVGVGVAAGAAAVVVRPATVCVQAVDAFGRIYMRCN